MDPCSWRKGARVNDAAAHHHGPSWRWVGTWIGVALFIAAGVVVFRQRQELAEAWNHLRNPSPVVLATALAGVIANLIFSGVLFSVLMRRFGRVGLLEMQGLISAASLLNYLPLRPGMFGRIEYHRAVNRIRARDSLRTIIESMVLSVVTAAGMAGLVLASHLADGSAVLMVGVGVGLLILGTMVPSVRLPAVAALIKTGELLVWSVRYWAVFQLVGVSLSVDSAIVMACCAVGISTIPLAGNGLGLREWLVGLLASALANVSLEQGVAADLVHRALEIAAVAPLGALSFIWVLRRRAAIPPAASARSVAQGSRGPAPCPPSPQPPES